MKALPAIGRLDRLAAILRRTFTLPTEGAQRRDRPRLRGPRPRRRVPELPGARQVHDPARRGDRQARLLSARARPRARLAEPRMGPSLPPRPPPFDPRRASAHTRAGLPRTADRPGRWAADVNPRWRPRPRCGQNVRAWARDAGSACVE